MTRPTMWHVTLQQEFTPDPEYAPQGGEGMGAVFGKGLFLTPNPELWSFLWRTDGVSGTQYAAEVDTSGLSDSECYEVGMPDRDQWWVPAKALAHVKVKRTVPIATAVSEARKKGYGFAMISRDAIQPTRLCIVDHKKGWGNPTALCRGVTDGNPLKWTTIHDAATGPLSGHICPECMAKIAPIARRHP